MLLPCRAGPMQPYLHSHRRWLGGDSLGPLHQAQRRGVLLMCSLPEEPFPTAQFAPEQLPGVQFEGSASMMTCRGPAQSSHSSVVFLGSIRTEFNMPTWHS